MCEYDAILEKENIQLTASLEQLRILYNSNRNKRELINIGAISKTLFGTIDVDDKHSE